MRIRMWCSSDRGLVRENNEDAAWAGGSFVRDGSVQGEFESGGILPFLVADGMGGHSHGEVASDVALRSLVRLMEGLDASGRGFKPEFEGMLRLVHEELLGLAPQYGDLGTTLCGVVFFGPDRVVHLNVGDSRLYRLRGRFLRQLSVDHSLRQETGNPTIPGNWLTSVLGGGTQELKVNVKDLSRLVRAGDTLLLCSDGLSEYVPGDEILAALRPAVENPADELVAAALAQGGPDNVTTVVLKLS